MAERSGNAAAAEQQYLKLAAAGNNDGVEQLMGSLYASKSALRR